MGNACSTKYVLKLTYGKNTEYDLRHISDFKERDPIFLHPEIFSY